MTKKHTIFLSMALILTLCFSLAVAAAEYATVDMAKCTNTGVGGEPNNGFTPEVIFDGDEFTRWGSMTQDDTVTAVFDKAYNIDAIEIRFFKAEERAHYMLLEYSTDGNNWTEIKSTKPHSTPDPALALTGLEDGYMETFPLVNPVTAQYFRFTYLGREEAGSVTGDVANVTATIGSMWEMKFVVAAAAPEPTPAAEVAPAVDTPAPAAEVAPVVTSTPAPAAAPAAAPATGVTATFVILSTLGSAVVFNRVRKSK